MPLPEVAAEIEGRRLYLRNDGQAAQASQLRRRAIQSNGRYRHLFEVQKGSIRLRDTDPILQRDASLQAESIETRGARVSDSNSGAGPRNRPEDVELVLQELNELLDL